MLLKLHLKNIVDISLLILLCSCATLHAQYLDKGKLKGNIKYLKQLNYQCEIIDEKLIVVDSSYHNTNEEYEYFNNKQGQITRKNFIGSGYNRSRIYEYDSLNRVLRMEIINSNDSLSGYQEYEYDSDDRVVYWHVNNGKYTHINTYEYFPDGKLHLLFSERPFSNTISKSVNHYDTERRRVKTEIFDKIDSLTGIITYEYFEENDTKLKTYTNMISGSTRKTEYYIKNGLSVNKQNGIVKTYNENGDIMSIKFTNSKNNNETLYKYKYDEFGNWVERFEYRFNGSITLYTREIEYY